MSIFSLLNSVFVFLMYHCECVQQGKGKLESWLADEMDKFIADAFMTGSENAFTQMLHLIMSENVSVDYQVCCGISKIITYS